MFGSISLDERSIVGQRVDADRGVIGYSDHDPVTSLQNPELLKAFEHLGPAGRHLAESQKKIAAIGVQSDMLIEMSRFGGKQVVGPVPRMGDNAPTEVHRTAFSVENDLHAGRVFELLTRSDWGRQCGHDGSWFVFEKVDYLVDRLAGDLWLVALNINEKTDLGHLSGHFRHAISATSGVRVSHNRLSAIRLDRLENFFMVGRHADSIGSSRPGRRLIGMADQRSAGLVQQQFLGKSCRRKPCWYNDLHVLVAGVPSIVVHELSGRPSVEVRVLQYPLVLHVKALFPKIDFGGGRVI